MNSQTQKLLSITSLIGLCLILGCSKPSSTPAPSVNAAGGIDSSGGNSIKSNQAQIEAVLVDVKQNMKVAFHRIQIIMDQTAGPLNPKGEFPDGGPISSIDGSYPSTSSDYFRKLLSGFKTSKPKKTDNIYELVTQVSNFETPEETIDRLSFHFSNNDCSSREGDREASVNETAEICLSLPRLLQLPPESLKLQINALIFHEIAHVRRTDPDETQDEKNAVALQKWFIRAQQTMLRQSEVIHDSSGNYLRDNYTEPDFSNLYRHFDEIQATFQDLQDDVQKNLMSPEQICPNLYKLFINYPQTLKKALAESGLQLPPKIMTLVYIYPSLPIEIMKSPELRCEDIIIIDADTSDSAIQQKKQNHQQFRSELIKELLLSSKRLSQIRRSIEEFQVLKVHHTAFGSWNTRRLANIALMPFYKNGQIYSDVWLRNTPSTQVDEVECKITDLKTQSIVLFQPKSEESVFIQNGTSKSYGFYENSFLFVPSLGSTQMSKLTLSFTKDFFGQFANNELRKFPQLNFKLRSDSNNDSVILQQATNAYVDEKGAAAILQKNSVESFAFTFSVVETAKSMTHAQTTLPKFEIRCGIKPVNQGPLETNIFY